MLRTGPDHDIGASGWNGAIKPQVLIWKRIEKCFAEDINIIDLSLVGLKKSIDTVTESAYSRAMLKLKPIILLLALALLVQNTCPFGAAGKTAVAAACVHCPLHQKLVAVSIQDGLQLAPGSSSIHFPLYVFSLPRTIHTFQLEPVVSAGPIIADGYTDACPTELLRPPRS